MAFTKIENSDFNNAGALKLPDRPSETMSAHAIKTMFDATSRQVVAPKFNDLIDELEATTAAAQIGAVAPPGARGNNVQAVLNSVFGAVSTAVVDVAEIKSKLSAVMVSVEELEEEAHTHENKDLLDTYTQSDTDLADAVEKKHVHPNRSLLDTYEQTESDLADAVSKKHTHDNKPLLDTYEQTESDLSDAVSKKHTHSNKALLDTYTQTESDLASAVADDHTHSNKALLDTYEQTESDLASAVSNTHSHSNKSVLDKFGESSGQPTYNGSAIGGGDAYKTVKVGSSNIVASGADTLELVAGTNVILTPDTTNKKVTISAGATSSPSVQVTPILTSGVKIAVIKVDGTDNDIYAPQGGSVVGYMATADYDSDLTVKTAGGIKRYVQSEISAQITSALTASY